MDNDSTVSNFNPNPGQDGTQPQDGTQAMTPPAAPAPAPAQPTGQSPADQSAIQTASNPLVATPTLTPAQEHANLFQKIFGVVAGGGRVARRDAQGNPVTNPDGTVVTDQASVKQLGAGILAGALSSMIAGFQHLPERNGNGIVESHLGEAAAAGAQAGAQQSQTARVQQSQKQADDLRLRQYQTIQQNYDLQSMAIQSHALGDKAILQTTAEFQPLHDYLVQESANSPEIQKAILGDELGEDEMHQMMKDATAHGVKDTAIPAGTRPEIGPDGKPTGRLQQTWMVLGNDAKINLTPELQEKYGLQNLPVGTAVPLANLMKFGTQSSVNNNISQTMGELGEEAGSNKSWADLQKSNTIFRTPAAIKALQGIAGHPLDEALQIIGSAPNVGGQLRDAIVHGFGITPKQLEQMALQRDTAKKAADVANDPDKQPASSALVASFRADTKASYPGLTDGQVSSLVRGLGPHPTQGDLKQANDRAEKQANTNIAQIAAQAQRDSNNSTKGSEQMFKTGINPVSHERLSLENAPDEMMVDTKTGNPIPTGMLTTLKPTMQESNRADFAKSAIHSLDSMNALIDSSEAKFGPISGPVDKWMAGHGLGGKFEQAALNYLTFAQSAATGAHVGGRFNVPIMDKMGTTVSANMSKDQLQGATDSIKDVMQQYVDQGGRYTVAQYRSLPQAERDRLKGVSQTQPQTSQVVPAGAIAGRDASGKIIGYKTADGKVVKF